MRFLFPVCLSVFLLIGCATSKVLQPIAGSKGDGTVTLAYDYDLFEEPVINWDLSNETAKTRCNAWGFKNAQRFAGSQTLCTERTSAGSCYTSQVNVTYQCIN